MNTNLKVIIGYILVIAVILYVGANMLGLGPKEDPIYSDIIGYFENGEVETNTIERPHWIIDTEIPIFKGEDRQYIDKLIFI